MRRTPCITDRSPCYSAVALEGHQLRRSAQLTDRCAAIYARHVRRFMDSTGAKSEYRGSSLSPQSSVLQRFASFVAGGCAGQSSAGQGACEGRRIHSDEGRRCKGICDSCVAAACRGLMGRAAAPRSEIASHALPLCRTHTHTLTLSLTLARARASTLPLCHSTVGCRSVARSTLQPPQCSRKSSMPHRRRRIRSRPAAFGHVLRSCTDMWIGLCAAGASAAEHADDRERGYVGAAVVKRRGHRTADDVQRHVGADVQRVGCAMLYTEL
jgi:hypothetical protein